ncbi:MULTISPECIES: DUF2809 domain-containing protein [unclassified Microbacterium]|uniref:DUF2809 domain-containing protein n=1 Tax=unclassified Microbacterium TaxID=2609290 RepID=UPI00386F3981
MASRTVLIRRAAALVAVVIVVAAGLAVHLWAPETPASDIAGDALYVAAVASALVVVAPRLSTRFVGAVVLCWCIGVELFQLTGLPSRWGSEFPPALLVFGTVFDPRDLVIYAVAVLVVMVADAGARRAVDLRLSSRAAGAQS